MPLKIEGLYLPDPRVKKLESFVPREKVSQVVVNEYLRKGHVSGAVSVIDQALQLLSEENPDLCDLLQDPQIDWHLEKWPIDLLRMTRINPNPNDPFSNYHLVLSSGKKFKKFAQQLLLHPEIMAKDLGFEVKPKRDSSPVIGIRGRLHNHIIDGHHRTTIFSWQGQNRIPCLTAYKRFNISFTT